VQPGIREDLAEPVGLAEVLLEPKDQTHQKREQALTDLAVAEVHLDMDLLVVKKVVTEDLVL
jgi:hypothetical protein